MKILLFGSQGYFIYIIKGLSVDNLILHSRQISYIKASVNLDQYFAILSDVNKFLLYQIENSMINKTPS